MKGHESPINLTPGVCLWMVGGTCRLNTGPSPSTFLLWGVSANHCTTVLPRLIIINKYNLTKKTHCLFHTQQSLQDRQKNILTSCSTLNLAISLRRSCPTDGLPCRRASTPPWLPALPWTQMCKPNLPLQPVWPEHKAPPRRTSAAEPPPRRPGYPQTDLSPEHLHRGEWHVRGERLRRGLICVPFVGVMGLTRLLLLYTNTVPADESFGAVAAERAFCVGTNLIQTVTG